MTQDRAHWDALDAYLLRMREKLQRLPHAQVSEILVELRSHILERAGSTNSTITDATVREALDRLGAPDTLAEMYLAENLMDRAERTRSPWVVMGTLFRLAIKSGWALMVFLASLIGYGIAATFFLCAVAKPFYPDHVGLWWNFKDHTLVALGFIWPEQFDREVLGWWIIPLGLLGFTLAALTTTLFARWNIRLMRRSRRNPFVPPSALVSSRSAS